MVWIHGGAYTIGSGRHVRRQPARRRGDVVVVTLNYRLGALGFARISTHLDPGLAGSGNNGILDQIEALRWVRDNISAFGGDPGNVTIFGESAGGGSIGALLGAPDADGLYHKAIIQSGPVAIAPAYKPELLTDALLEALGAPAGGLAAFRQADPAQLVEAQTAIGALDRFGRDRDHAVDGSGGGLRPSVDGVVVHASPIEVVTARADENVPLLIGTNLDEGTLFSLLLPTDVTDDELVAAFPESVTDRQAIADGYAGRTTGRRLIVDLMTDTVFLVPSLRLADAQAATGAPVWTYLFTWPTPVFGGLLGATHALELPFVWDLIDKPTWLAFVGEDRRARRHRHAGCLAARSPGPAIPTLPVPFPGPGTTSPPARRSSSARSCAWSTIPARSGASSGTAPPRRPERPSAGPRLVPPGRMAQADPRCPWTPGCWPPRRGRCRSCSPSSATRCSGASESPGAMGGPRAHPRVVRLRRLPRTAALVAASHRLPAGALDHDDQRGLPRAAAQSDRDGPAPEHGTRTGSPGDHRPQSGRDARLGHRQPPPGAGVAPRPARLARRRPS